MEDLNTKINHAEVLSVISQRQAIAKSQDAEVPMLMCGNCGALLVDRDGMHADGSPAKDCCKTSAVLVDARTLVYNKEYTDPAGKKVPAGTEIQGAVQIVDKAAEIARLQAQIDELSK